MSIEEGLVERLEQVTRERDRYRRAYQEALGHLNDEACELIVSIAEGRSVMNLPPADAEIARLRGELEAEKSRPNAPSAWAQMKLERDLALEQNERLRTLLREARDDSWDAWRTRGCWLLDVDDALREEEQ